MGGAFDPPHKGHAQLLNAGWSFCQQRFGSLRPTVACFPTSDKGLVSQGKTPYYSWSNRLTLTSALLQDTSAIGGPALEDCWDSKILDHDHSLGWHGQAIKCLIWLRNQEPHGTLIWLGGEDLLKSIPKWVQFPDHFSLWSELWIYPRGIAPRQNHPRLGDELPTALQPFQKQILRLPGQPINAASTEFRQSQATEILTPSVAAAISSLNER